MEDTKSSNISKGLQILMKILDLVSPVKNYDHGLVRFFFFNLGKKRSAKILLRCLEFFTYFSAVLKKNMIKYIPVFNIL